MTAINILVQSDAAHILTDGAGYNDQGTFVSVTPKVFCLPHLSAAVAVSGTLPGMAAMMTTLGMESSYDGLKKAAPDYLNAALIASSRVSTSDLASDIRLFVVGWSKDGPDAYRVVTKGDPSTPAWTVMPITGLAISPPEAQAKLLPLFADKDPDAIDPKVDGLRILEEQRRHRSKIPGTGQRLFIVGGFGQLTSVRRDHITTEILHRWPDLVGKKIHPNAPPKLDPFEEAFAEAEKIERMGAVA